MNGYFDVSLFVNIFGPDDFVLVGRFRDTSGRSFTVTAHSLLDQIDQIKRVLIAWPELVDAAIARAQKELTARGLPPVREGGMKTPWVTPQVSFSCQLSYDDLGSLRETLGGSWTNNFFPPAPIKL